MKLVGDVEVHPLQALVEAGHPPTVRAEGELSYTNCEELGRLIEETLETSPIVELSLADMEFVDSSGLRVLVLAAGRASRQGGILRIVSMDRQLRHALKLTGFAGFFEIAPNACADGASHSICELTDSAYGFSVHCRNGACHAARQNVRGFAAKMGFSEEAQDDICLAVGEAVSNVIRHGNNADNTSIGVSCESEGGALRIYLRYRSSPFDPKSVPKPDIASGPSGGMGIYFMNLAMDEVDYDFHSGWANLKLEKRMES